MFCWVFRVLALVKKYEGRASRKSLKLSCYNNPHAFSPPLPLTQLRVWLIPMTEAELAPRLWWEQEVLTFYSCHPLTKAGFDSHLIPLWVDWNNKRAGKYSGVFFPPVSELNHPTVKSGASRRGRGCMQGRHQKSPFLQHQGPGWAGCAVSSLLITAAELPPQGAL